MGVTQSHSPTGTEEVSGCEKTPGGGGLLRQPGGFEGFRLVNELPDAEDSSAAQVVDADHHVVLEADAALPPHSNVAAAAAPDCSP